MGIWWSSTRATCCTLNVAESAAWENLYRQGSDVTSFRREQYNPFQILPSDTNQIEVKRTNKERERNKREVKNREVAKPLGLVLSN